METKNVGGASRQAKKDIGAFWRLPKNANRNGLSEKQHLRRYRSEIRQESLAMRYVHVLYSYALQLDKKGYK
jgi:hypothetical protein